jgi:IS30 family transposase
MASHFPFQERQVLYRLNKMKRPKAEMAAILGRDRSTIHRELSRNAGGRGYRPKQAQRKADERRQACRREPKMNDPELRKYVTRCLKRKWSPDQIAGHRRRELPRQPARCISHQTIYNWLAEQAPDCGFISVAAVAAARKKLAGEFPTASASRDGPRRSTPSGVTATGRGTRW